MKKFSSCLFVLLATISSGFAQTLPELNLNGSGTFIFVPYLNQKGDTASGTNEHAYLTLNIGAATESYGMNAAIGVSTDSAGNVKLNKVFFPAGTSNVITSYGGFGASVWVKPFNWLKFQAGYFADTTLSEKIPFSVCAKIT